jgi:hypothetical protein
MHNRTTVPQQERKTCLKIYMYHRQDTMPPHNGPNKQRIHNQPHPAFKPRAATCNQDLGRQERRRLDKEHAPPAAQHDLISNIADAIDAHMRNSSRH